MEGVGAGGLFKMGDENVNQSAIWRAGQFVSP